MSDAPHDPTAAERRYWLDDRRNVDRIVYAVGAVCAGLFLFDIFVPKHGPFAIEYVFGFYGLFGFIGCVGLVLAARAVRTILIRPENYYDR